MRDIKGSLDEEVVISSPEATTHTKFKATLAVSQTPSSLKAKYRDRYLCDYSWRSGIPRYDQMRCKG